MGFGSQDGVLYSCFKCYANRCSRSTMGKLARTHTRRYKETHKRQREVIKSKFEGSEEKVKEKNEGIVTDGSFLFSRSHFYPCKT